MGADKHSSKSGGYVGGFLQLFDWNAKSRKKLFSGKSDLPEQSKQKKRSDGNLPITQFKMMDEDDHLAVSSIKGSSDYSCASSVTDEEGYGTKAPSVVARLMGLDSMPTSDLAEPFSTPFFDSQSLRDTHFLRRDLELHRDRQITHSSNLRNMETPLQKAMDAKIQKMVNRPIEKFQTEMLPPKSAKSIPITHHKLLSPIKSPGFVPSNNAAHIMEAAAKIIEPGPPVSCSNKTKMPLLGTSSVPIKVREMREKAEAARRPASDTESFSSRRQVESNAAKFLKGQSANKSWNGTVDSALSRVSSNSEDSSSVKNKAKSVSLALQAKVNVQRREGLSSNGDRIIFGQRERNEVAPNQTFKSQPNSQRSAQKKPSGVLRQNNQKQNSLIDKQKLPSKPSPSNGSQGRKAATVNSSLGRQKGSKNGGSSKVGLRKLGSELPDGKREASCPGSNNVSRKRRITNGSYHSDSSQDTDNLFVNRIEKPMESSSSVLDRHFTWAEDAKRKGMDVVSFTFTAPMTRSLPLSEKVNGSPADYRGKNVINGSPAEYRGNVIGADALSILLEQKLRDLTYGVEPSRKRIGMAGDSASTFQDLVPSREMLHDQKHEEVKRGGYIFSSTHSPVFMPRHKSQGMFEMDDCSSEDTETRKMFNRRHPSPNSVLEPSFLTESCNSSDTADSYSLEGSKHASSVQAVEVFGTNSSKRLHLRGAADSELSDSASSTFRAASTSWELEYVNQILFNVELMFKDFALGRAREIINPHLFNQLENRKEVFGGGGNQGEELKLRRKVLFDCVSECMDLRCRRFANGGWSLWAKGVVTLRRKDRLAEEVYKEISGWRAMGDCMVDDLVDKDMSSHSGKWMDFEVEGFELGIEIEGSILNSLINEVVCDFLI